MQKFIKTIFLQKPSQVSLYFKLYANINSFKISQCFAVLLQALIESKALVIISLNTQKIPFTNPFNLEVFKNLSFILSSLNLHFSCNLVAPKALCFGLTGETFPGCQEEGLSVKPKRWNNSMSRHYNGLRHVLWVFPTCCAPWGWNTRYLQREVEFFNAKQKCQKQCSGGKGIDCLQRCLLGDSKMLLLFFHFTHMWFKEMRAFKAWIIYFRF